MALTEILDHTWNALTGFFQTLVLKIGNAPLQTLLHIILILAVAEIIGKVLKASKKVVFVLLAAALLAYLGVITIPWDDIKAAIDALINSAQSSAAFSSGSVSA